MNPEVMERPLRHVVVESELDIVAAVLAAKDRGESVRPVGAAGSKNACYKTAGTSLSFERYNRVLSVDGEYVTVQAGTTVGTLNAALAAQGLALPTNGEWAGATVAGALSSGTHGGSAAHGIFASSVESMRIVTAGGQILELRRGDPLFQHVAVSFGTFGVISTVTCRCEARFYLEMVMRVEPFERYVMQLATAQRAHEFYAAVWFPSARRVVTFAADRAPRPVRAVRRRERFCPATFLANKMSTHLGVNVLRNRWFTATAVDSWDRILTPIAGGSKRVQMLRRLSDDWQAAEVAIPSERAAETLGRLDAFLADHRHTLVNPVGLRASAADGFSLSPCYGRASFWMDLFYRRNDAFESALEDVVGDLDARCHWGKHMALRPVYLRRQYPRWDAFGSARASLDPDGMFANQFTRRFGL
ncbi:MAG TPA: D-arabinono-1,4-lactone oxidase [Gemmatimonadales bacterium]